MSSSIELMAQAKIARANGAAGLARQLEAMAKASAETLPIVAAKAVPIVFNGRSDADLAALQSVTVANELAAEDAARGMIEAITRQVLAAMAKISASPINLTSLVAEQLAASGDTLVVETAPIARKIGRAEESRAQVAAELRAEKAAKLAETTGLRAQRKVGPVVKNTPIPALRAHLTMAKARVEGTKGKQRVLAKQLVAKRQANLAAALEAAGLSD